MKFVINDVTFDFSKNKIALIDDSREITYSELYHNILAIGNVLQEHKIYTLGIYAGNSIDWCVIYLTAFFYHITIFPISKLMDKDDCYALCEKMGINALFCEENDIDKEKLSLEKIELPLNLSLYRINHCELDEELNDVSTVLFTSGTTGEQKGVMLTNENITANIQSVKKYMEYDEKDSMFIIKPLYHSSTLTAEFICGIFSNATLYIYTKPFNPLKVINIINTKEISILCGVPTMFASLVSYQKRYKGNLRAVSVSGSYLDNELMLNMQNAFHCKVFHVYGLSEASPRVTYLPPEHLADSIGSIGKAIPDVVVKIVDDNGVEITQRNVVGELYVNGKNVMKGYYKRPDLTAKAIQDGYLHTGDLGYYGDYGFIYLEGRKDDMIARGGVNIWPQPIEMAIRQLPNVEDVAVIGVEDYMYSQKLVAFVVENGELDPKDITKICMQNKVICPEQVEKIDKIPRNAMAKIQRNTLKKNYLN